MSWIFSQACRTFNQKLLQHFFEQGEVTKQESQLTTGAKNEIKRPGQFVGFGDACAGEGGRLNPNRSHL